MLDSWTLRDHLYKRKADEMLKELRKRNREARSAQCRTKTWFFYIPGDVEEESFR
jgi:hypothetical protein